MFIKSLFIFLFSFNLYATPSRIIIIRHAEKPDKGDHLSGRGYKRANALVGLFTNSSFSKKYGIPQFIFAANPKNQNGSVRSIETATPTAEYLNLYINQNFRRDDTDAISEEILNNPIYNNKIVLIVWPHQGIVDLTDALGALNFPDKWHDSDFDRLWVINYKRNAFASFDDLPQLLLDGDSQR